MTIDGITVLKEYDYNACPWWGAILAFFVIGMIFFVILSCAADAPPVLGIIGAVMVSGVIFVMFGFSSHWFATTKRYEVIIDDKVNYNELTEKYNIIEQDGLIVTLEKKVNSD